MIESRWGGREKESTCSSKVRTFKYIIRLEMKAIN